MTAEKTSALVLFAHGARDPEWAVPLRKIQRKVAARIPEIAVELAFLEIMQPTLTEAVSNLADAGHTAIAVAPMFIAQGAHLKRDLPQSLEDLRRSHPTVTFTLLPAIGDVDIIHDAISGWLVNMMRD